MVTTSILHFNIFILPYIDVVQVNFELCFIMGCGLIFHMFMSKHIKTNLGTIWAIIIITSLSIIFTAFMAAMGFLSLIQSESLLVYEIY